MIRFLRSDRPPGILLGLAAAATSLALSPALTARDSGYLVTKGRLFLQTSATAPTPLASGGALFLAEAPGFSGPPLVAGAQVTPPGATSLAMSYVAGADVFRYQAPADSPAALATRFPAGTYTLNLVGDPFSGLPSSSTLPADAFPAAIQVVNFADTQAIRVDDDLQIRLVLPGTAQDSDSIDLTVQDGSEVVYSDTPPATEPVVTIGSGSFTAGKTLELRLRYSHLAADTEALVPVFTGFFSETRLTIRTIAGGGPVDTTPPTLETSLPANGSGNNPPASPIYFGFSEPMDPAFINIAFTPALDPAKLTYSWFPENKVLSVSHAGGFPGGTLAWALNPAPGAANNFRDAAGNVLSPGTTSGSFAFLGGASGCDSTDPVEASGFGLFKLVNHRQTDAGTPVNDTTLGASIHALSRIYNAPGRAALEFPADPAPKPHQLKFFGQLTGMEFFNQDFAGRADLDAAYPAGQYDFQLRDPKAPTVVVQHVILNLLANGYPSAPHFANFAAAQTIDTNADFTLTWDAFTGAVAGTDSLALEIDDADGNPVLSLPDNCAHRPLAVTATSAVLPRGLLRGGGSTYTAALTFYKINDHDKAMPGTGAKGFAAVARTTRMPLKTTASSTTPPTAPVIQGVQLDAAGQLRLTVACPTGHPLVLESSLNPGAGYGPILTTNVTVSPVVLTIPPASNHAFLRARVD